MLKALALLLGLAGAVAWYLSLPTQRWLPRPLPGWPARGVLLAALAGGFLALRADGLSLPAALFGQAVITMLVLGLVPFSALWTDNRAGPVARNGGDGLSSGTPVRRAPLRPHWWGKSLVGVLLGFALALGLSGLWAWWGPGGIEAADKVQFNMWIVTPMWMTALGAVYFMRSAWRALAWLGLANVLVWVLLALARGGGHA